MQCKRGKGGKLLYIKVLEGERNYRRGATRHSDARLGRAREFGIYNDLVFSNRRPTVRGDNCVKPMELIARATALLGTSRKIILQKQFRKNLIFNENDNHTMKS